MAVVQPCAMGMIDRVGSLLFLSTIAGAGLLIAALGVTRRHEGRDPGAGREEPRQSALPPIKERDNGCALLRQLWIQDRRGVDVLRTEGEVIGTLARLTGGEPLTPAEWARVRAWYDDRREVIELLHRACRRPAWRLPDGLGSPPLLLLLRGAHCLAASAVLAARDGDTEEAVRRCRDVLYWATVCDERPWLMQVVLWNAMHNVALDACEVVLDCTPDGVDVEAWRPFLDPDQVATRFLRCVRGDRAQWLEGIGLVLGGEDSDRASEGRPLSSWEPSDSGVPPALRLLHTLAARQTVRAELRSWDELIGALRVVEPGRLRDARLPSWGGSRPWTCQCVFSGSLYDARIHGLLDTEERLEAFCERLGF